MSYLERSEEEVKLPWLDVDRQATDKQRSYLRTRRKRRQHFKSAQELGGKKKSVEAATQQKEDRNDFAIHQQIKPHTDLVQLARSSAPTIDSFQLFFEDRRQDQPIK